MVKIRNNHAQHLELILRGAPVDGVPKTRCVPAGEAVEDEFDVDHFHTRNLEKIGLVSIEPVAKKGK